MNISNKQKIILGVTLIIIIAGFGLLYVKNKKASNVLKDSDGKVFTTSQNSTSTTIVDKANGATYTITRLSQKNNSITVPDISRPVVFDSSVTLTDDVKVLIENKIKTIQNSIKNNPNGIGLWIELGVYQKMAGDYEGSVLSWKYAGDASNDYVAYRNLGDLYAYYLHDNGMSETYFRKSLQRDPSQAYTYIQLASVYKDVFKDAAKAKTVLDEGLSKIPNDPSLLEAKKNL